MNTLVALLVALIVVVSCEHYPHNVRFYHASVDAPALDVYVNGVREVEALYFGEASDYMLVHTARNMQVTLFVHNGYEELASFVVTPEQYMKGCPQIFVIYGMYDDLMWKFVDQYCNYHGQGAFVNFVHLYNNLGEVDVLLGEKGKCTGDVDDMGYHEIWSYVDYDTVTDMHMVTQVYGEEEIYAKVRLSREPKPKVADVSFDPSHGKTYTIFAIGEFSSDPWSVCNSGGSGVTGNCPDYQLRQGTLMVLPSEFTSTCN